jgi:hypothetical protein
MKLLREGSPENQVKSMYLAGEKFLIFDLTMSLESPQKVITKTKI